jgi:TonB family protein
MTAVASLATVTLNGEFQAMRARFHRALAVSVGVHALLALTLTLLNDARPVAPRIVEVTWLEPAVETVTAPVVEPEAEPRVEPRVEAPVAPIAAPLPESPAPARPRPRQDTQVAAGPPRADVKVAAAARREAQLAELKATRNAVSRDLNPAPASTAMHQLPAAVPTSGMDLTRMASGAMLPVAEKGRPGALPRGPAVGTTPAVLKRGPTVVSGGLSLAAVGAVGGAGGSNGSNGSASTQPAVAPGESGTAPGDILLEGPAAARPVVISKLPQYPDWARKQAVEAVVTLHFSVLPDGRVREDVQVLKTGGFTEFDERAVAALRQWRFVALADGDASGQWGTITFRFRLHG